MENMEKLYRQASNLALLKKSGIIAAIVTFTLLGAWFGFSKLSLGAYNEKNLTKQFLAENSMVFKTIVIEVGSDTVARIIAGTSSMTLTGTATYPGQPRIEYSGATGKWSFKNSGGTETVAFGTVSAAYVAAEIGSVTANYVLQNNGSSTGQQITNSTLAGSTTIGTTSTITAAGTTFSATKVKYLADVDESIEPHFTTVEASISGHAHAGTDSVKISHDNVLGTGTTSHADLDTFKNSKAQASGVASLDANSRVVQNPSSGTSTPGASKIPISLGTGFLNDSWLSSVISKLGADIQFGTETTGNTDNISEGSVNLYYTNNRVNATIGSRTLSQLSDTGNAGSATEGQFLKRVGTGWQGAASVVTTYWSDILGHPTEGTATNSYISETPGADKIPFSRNDGKLVWSWIDDTIVSISATTTTTLSGTGSTARIFNAQKTTEVTGSSTAFDDSSSSNHTLTPGGNIPAVMSTAQKKFGLSAGLFDGVDANHSSYVTIPAHANWNFGQNDFTIEIQRKSTDTASMGSFGWGATPNDGLFFETSGNTAKLYLISTGTDSATIAAAAAFGTLGTTTFNHVVISRQGNFLRGFTDGVQGATWTVTGKTFNHSGNALTIGVFPNLSTYPFNGYLDELRISNIARYTGNYATPTSAFVSDANTLLLVNFDRPDTSYFSNRLAYVLPGTTMAFMNILSDATQTTKVEMVLGSETPFSSTTTHVLQGITASRTLFGFYDSYCFEASKDIIGSGTGVQDEAYAIAKRVSIVKSHPVDPENKVTQVEAEFAAQEDYMNLFRDSDIEAYKSVHIAEYTTSVPGSVSVNLNKLNSDAQAYHEMQRKAEFEILPDLTDRIKKKKKTMESDKAVTNISIIADDPSTDDLLKGADNRTASVGNQLGVLFGAFQKQTEEIGSLTAALENQKIAYNEEVDNLYQLINAIIVALLAVGGVSGWSTIRRKRKGT